MSEETPITVREAGAKGGGRTRDLYGSGHFRDIGKMGGQQTVQRHRALLKEFGKRGGRPRRPSLDIQNMGGEHLEK